MRNAKTAIVWTCRSCLRAQARQQARSQLIRPGGANAYTTSTRLYDDQHAATKQEDGSNQGTEEKEQGALSRRLTQMVEETMNTGSRSDRKTMSEAGFSAELKKELEERIAQSSFQAQNSQAFSQINMPAAAGQGTRQQAAAKPWTGTESLEDGTLRMLDDAHKKLRQPSRIPRPALNVRPPTKQKVSTADRLVNARDRTSRYALSQQADLTEEEREKMRQELKERFTPGARAMPTTLQGLASLANERIEDAIARGQFRNIQRGKGVNTERDYTANSPFIDTTEYFMNKIIQKQEIVPPWIEKQQELMKLVATFRARLRYDWKRHAARSISSIGGALEDQVRRAKGFALAEERVNPRTVRREGVTGIDSTGNLRTITIEERIAAGVPVEEEAPTSQPVVTIKVTESATQDAPPTSDAQSIALEVPSELIPTSIPTSTSASTPPNTVEGSSSPSSSERVLPTPYPFRDPAWEKTELSYQTLAIGEINSLTRSYNLMAPKIAQKPYYTLQRELNRCYAEVAPLLADEILERSRKPKVRIEVIGHREGSVMSKFDGGGHVAKVRDEDSKKGYGFKQFWRDLFSKEDESRSRRNSVA